jgi:hypothetical protein
MPTNPLLDRWLPDDTLLFYPDRTRPATRWLLNLSTQVITEVVALAPDEQQRILAHIQATEQVVAEQRRREPNSLSPDGHYMYTGNPRLIIWDDSGNIYNSVDPNLFWLGVTDCGWSPDSRGYYFIERSRGGHLLSRQAQSVSCLSIRRHHRTGYGSAVGASSLLVAMSSDVVTIEGQALEHN